MDNISGASVPRSQPLVVGMGGTTRPNSSTEKVVRLVLDAAAANGARTVQFTGSELVLPIYDPDKVERCAKSRQLVNTLRAADCVVIGSPGYHGCISGLMKNAIDYMEDMAADVRPYLEGLPVGCVGTGAGWQGANATLGAIRVISHSLRAWPTPLGIAANTIDSLFDTLGNCLQPALLKQTKLMADQLLSFWERGSVAVRIQEQTRSI